MTARPERAWEGDDVHNACQAWLVGWRQTHGEEQAAPWSLVRDVGESARRLSTSGIGRVELARLMWAAGQDGVAAPDTDPGSSGAGEAA